MRKSSEREPVVLAYKFASGVGWPAGGEASSPPHEWVADGRAVEEGTTNVYAEATSPCGTKGLDQDRGAAHSRGRACVVHGGCI